MPHALTNRAEVAKRGDATFNQTQTERVKPPKTVLLCHAFVLS